MGSTPPPRQKVVIVGAGPVGSLAALFAASRGDDVEVYELRGDLRDPSTIPLNFTKAINLALSERGINSMRQSRRTPVIDQLLRDAIPMYGRMIHGRDSNRRLHETAQPYDVHGRAINAVDRSNLNNALLDELEQNTNVKLFFNHKLTGADFRTKKAWFERQRPVEGESLGASSKKATTGTSTDILGDGLKRAPEIEVDFDFIIGADGAHSATRFHMMKFARVDYHQEYIDTLWCEFHIPPNEDGQFRISPNHLHIWPGQEFMFIALPSSDRSFTCTLFAPAKNYAALDKSPHQVVEFFNDHFPGVCPELIPPKALQEQYCVNPHLPLISIKSRPHHFDSSVVIIGDAAHAVVPFYGQGLNCGMEDVRILFDILDEYGVYDAFASSKQIKESRAKALAAYTTVRVPDTWAINKLSFQNYHEMRSGVTSRLYKYRKYIEESLDKYIPQLGWSTQYARVSFSNIRYSEVVLASERQRRVLGLTVGAFSVMAMVGASALVARFSQHRHSRSIFQLLQGWVLSTWRTFAR